MSGLVRAGPTGALRIFSGVVMWALIGVTLVGPTRFPRQAKKRSRYKDRFPTPCCGSSRAARWRTVRTEFENGEWQKSYPKRSTFRFAAVGC
jgi:hypothetical protein